MDGGFNEIAVDKSRGFDPKLSAKLVEFRNSYLKACRSDSDAELFGVFFENDIKRPFFAGSDSFSGSKEIRFELLRLLGA
jgi:hypothetical protein